MPHPVSGTPLTTGDELGGRGRFKDAVDLNTLRADLAGVVNRALEPTHVSVWTARD